MTVAHLDPERSDYERNVLASLTKINERVQVYKLTMLYIAGLLTMWMILVLCGVA